MDVQSVFIHPPLSQPKGQNQLKPDLYALCTMTRKGRIVIHRRWIQELLGINLSHPIHMAVSEQQYHDGELKSFLLVPTSESHPFRITISRFHESSVIELNTFFYTENLNYKRFRFTLLSEPVLLTDGVKGVRLTMNETTVWPEYAHKTMERIESTLLSSTLVCIDKTARLQSILTTAPTSSNHKLIQDLLVTYFKWRATQEKQTDAFEFEESFEEFCRQFNRELFRLSIPPSLPTNK